MYYLNCHLEAAISHDQHHALALHMGYIGLKEMWVVLSVQMSA